MDKENPNSTNDNAPIDPVTDAVAYGIDISLIEVNLELSPQARIERHESALELVNELRKAGERLSKA